MQVRLQNQCAQLETPDRPAHFQVWIDDMGLTVPPEWDWNSPPRPLWNALEEARACRAMGYLTVVMPEGIRPKSDGSFD